MLFWDHVLEWAAAQDRAALFLHLPGLAEGGPVQHALAACLAASARPHATVQREQRAMLQSSLPPEDYLDQSLSGKKRKELRRQHRRLAEEGVLTVERLADAEGLAMWTQEFLSLERAGWKGEAGSALACDPRTQSLFVQSLEGAGRRGRLDRLAIRLDGRPLAMLASFRCPPGLFSFKTAFDEAFARFSPGVLLQRENLALLGQPGIEWADSCAAADHPMIDHFWRERRTISAVNVGTGGPVRRLLFRALAAWETRSIPRDY
jgi:CelD/BcsL family acetyltransferase involved in cellulose biosynthesis